LREAKPKAFVGFCAARTLREGTSTQQPSKFWVSYLNPTYKDVGWVARSKTQGICWVLLRARYAGLNPTTIKIVF